MSFASAGRTPSPAGLSRARPEPSASAQGATARERCRHLLCEVGERVRQRHEREGHAEDGATLVSGTDRPEDRDEQPQPARNRSDRDERRPARGRAKHLMFDELRHAVVWAHLVQPEQPTRRRSDHPGDDRGARHRTASVTPSVQPSAHLPHVPARHPITWFGRPGKSSPAPPFTKSYSSPDHLPGKPSIVRIWVSPASYRNPRQSGERHPLVSYGAAAERPSPNCLESTRNRPRKDGWSLA